jgi:hypothetical protein
MRADTSPGWLFFRSEDSLVWSLARKLDARPTLRLASDDQPILILTAVKKLLL